MVASRETLQDIAAERQLQPATLERVIRLIDILDAFDWRSASPEAIGCDVSDITSKLAMCVHDRYFDTFGGPEAWIETATAVCRDKLAPLFQFTAAQRAFLDAALDRGEIDTSSLDVPESVCAAIEACPALRRKTQNVRAWKSGDQSLAPRARRKPPTRKSAS